MLHIIGIEDADLSKVLTVGASIGADGAAYGVISTIPNWAAVWVLSPFHRVVT